jgi:hypothetical protein
VRNIKQHPLAGRLSHPARLRRRDDGAGGPTYPGPSICQVRSSARHELCFDTSPGGAHARTHSPEVLSPDIFTGASSSSLNIPIGLTGLILVYLHLPDYREERTAPLDAVGLILFGSGVALLSYALEIFGEHTLSAGVISGLLVLSIVLLAGYGIHGSSLPFPLAEAQIVWYSHFPRRRKRQLLHSTRDRRSTISRSCDRMAECP